ncbi:MAG: efflux transporter outer membrane subunit [Pseudomonadota bacterium]
MRVLTVICSAALCVACASTDRSSEAIEGFDAPKTWRANTAAGGLASNWLDEFSDARLNAIVAEALNNNQNLAATAERLEQARSRATATRSPLFPSLDASTSATQNISNSRSRQGRDSTQTYGLALQSSWEIDVWGRLTDQARSGYRGYTAAQADYEAARLSLAGSVTQNWFALVEARQQTSLAERDVLNRSSSLAVVERRYERGVSESLDVRLSRSALAGSEATLALRRQQEGEAARRLEILLGRYPEGALDAGAQLPEIQNLPGAGAPGDILARRPDLVAAEDRLVAAGLDARAARKAMLPRLTLRSTLSTIDGDFSDAFDLDGLAGELINGLVAQPLFGGARLVAEANRAEAAAREAAYRYADAVLAAYREAEDALAAEITLAAQEDAQNLSFSEAREAEILTQRQYANGLATIFELLDAQGRRITAESQYLAVRRERLSNRVRLYQALGGPFETRTEIAEATNVKGSSS